ncbi:MAG: hypothetical protein PHS41_00915 [Victivallaceae bacterium]|nr:hypothetical protein [Victivallaceae bacterium]
MNRSILVVICDFLILSMFALNTVGPSQQEGGSPLPVIVGKVEAKKTEATSPEKALAEIAGERDALANALRRTVDELKLERERLRTMQTETVELEKRNLRTGRTLESTRRELAESRGKLSVMNERLSEYRVSLSTQERELITALEKLERSIGELKQSNLQSDEYRKKLGEYEVNISYTSGKLSTIERELAETKGRLSVTARNLGSREVELGESRRQVDHLRGMLSSTVADLGAERRTGIEKQQKLYELQKLLAEAANRPSDSVRRDVFSSYAQAVGKFSVVMREDRLFSDFVGGGDYYLPVLELNKRRILIFDFGKLTGNPPGRTNFNRVSELGYSFAKAGAAGKGKSVQGPMGYWKKSPAIGVFELGEHANGFTALKILTAEELKKRGTEDLYLFKAGSAGRDSVNLAGRCSLDLASEYQSLCLRNAGRSVVSELRAEPGDFVLTGDGKFAALVTHIESFDQGRRQEARCFVFPKDFRFEDVKNVDISSKNSDGLYQVFAKDASEALRQAGEESRN